MATLGVEEARTLLAFLAEIDALEDEAHCSDRYFRRHFMALAHGAQMARAKEALRAAAAGEDAKPAQSEGPVRAKSKTAKG